MIARESVTRWSPAHPATARQPAGSAVRGSAVDRVLRLQRTAGNLATRRVLARQDQDPGPPEMPDMTGLTCGFKEGKPFCQIYAKGETLDVDPGSLSPDVRKAAFDPKRPNNCPPERWNWFWQSCCAPGKHFRADQRQCVGINEAPSELPPPPPAEKGDFPLPQDDQFYA